MIVLEQLGVLILGWGYFMRWEDGAATVRYECIRMMSQNKGKAKLGEAN